MVEVHERWFYGLLRYEKKNFFFENHSIMENKGGQEDGTPEQFSVSCKLGYFGIGKILFNKLTAYFGFA